MFWIGLCIIVGGILVAVGTESAGKTIAAALLKVGDQITAVLKEKL